MFILLDAPGTCMRKWFKTEEDLRTPGLQYGGLCGPYSEKEQECWETHHKYSFTFSAELTKKERAISWTQK